jgi:hypothetical protein
MFIFGDIVDRISVDLERLMAKYRVKTAADDFKDNKIEELNTKLNDLEKDNEEIKKENQRHKTTIGNLKSQIDSLNSAKKEEIEEYEELNLALQRKNNKITNNYNSLLSKYEALKKQLGISEEVDDREEIIQELDMNGRYTFIVYDDVTFKGQIRSAFPNAEFASKSKQVKYDSTDMVIMLTSHIDHSTYYDVRNKCKNLGVPAIHCEHTNIDLIKQLMWNELYL